MNLHLHDLDVAKLAVHETTFTSPRRKMKLSFFFFLRSHTKGFKGPYCYSTHKHQIQFISSLVDKFRSHSKMKN